MYLHVILMNYINIRNHLCGSNLNKYKCCNAKVAVYWPFLLLAIYTSFYYLYWIGVITILSKSSIADILFCTLYKYACIIATNEQTPQFIVNNRFLQHSLNPSPQPNSANMRQSISFIGPIAILLLASCCIANPTKDPHAAINDVCKGMPPIHKDTVATQSLIAPYTISVARDHIQSGDTISVHLQGNDVAVDKFRGFLVQGKNVTNATPIGQFVVRDDDIDVKTIDCVAAGSKNTVFQKRMRVDKEYVDFVWQAPDDFVGQVVFDATVVKTFAEYWVGLSSPVVTVEAKKWYVEMSYTNVSDHFVVVAEKYKLKYPQVHFL